MILHKDIAKKTAEVLLKVKAIKLSPTEPFTWASGWKSPIYCDNRVTLSYPPVRVFLKEEISKIIDIESVIKPLQNLNEVQKFRFKDKLDDS